MENNTLLESYQTMISESVLKFDAKIESLLNRYKDGIDAINKIPPETDKFVECNLTTEAGKIELVYKDKKGNNRKAVQNVGKILKKLYPEIDVVKDPTVQKLILELKKLSANSAESELEKYGVKIDVYDDVSKWYKDCSRNGITSCVTGDETRTLGAFSKDPNIQIVIITDADSGELMGRALLWHNVEDTENRVFNTYLDRTYPANDDKIKTIYTTWANINNYWFRTNVGYGDNQIISGKKMKVRFRFEDTPENIKWLPYMDSFKNLYKSTKFGNLIGTNYKTGNRNWWAESTSNRIG